MRLIRPKPSMRRYISFWILLLAISVAGCSQPTVTMVPSISPTQTPTLIPSPTISSPPKPAMDPVGEISIETGQRIIIRANATGAEKYEWGLQGDGLISATEGDAVFYSAPAEGSGMAIVSVTAHNAQGISSPTSLIISALPIATVRMDALAIPHPIIGRGFPESLIKLDRSLNGCYTGTDCTRFTYMPGGKQGGVYWWPQSMGVIMDISCQKTEEWGRICIATIKTPTLEEIQNSTISTNVLKGGNLNEVHRLTFWARGGKGGEIVTFTVGGEGIPPEPSRSLGKVTLTSLWEPYVIDLEGIDLTNAIILFRWDATDTDNPQGAVFYLDDIQFEGVKEATQVYQSASPVLADLLTSLCWIAYSPTHFDPTAPSIQWPSESDVREDLRVLRDAGFNGLVTYDSNYMNRDAPDQPLDISGLAQEAGFESMIVGVWDPNNDKELQLAEQAGLHPIVVGYSVGNEGLDVRYDLDTLVFAMERLRNTTGKPVSTTEEIHDYYENSPLWDISDWIFPNAHPYFSGYRNPQEAVEWTKKVFETLDSVSDKLLIFKEVGLPSGGDTSLNEARQAMYYQLLRETGVTYVVFEAFDAPWKHLGQPNSDGTYPLPDPEPHWGIFTSERTPKQAAGGICPAR